MLLLNKEEDIRILEFLETIKNDATNYYSIYFHFSRLEERNKNDFQLKIALNIIKDFFKNSLGCITYFQNHDIVIVFSSNDQTIIEKIIFQLRYLFIDDLLAFELEGVENRKFCNVYMLSFQWHDFYMLCNKQLSSTKANFLYENSDKPDEIKEDLPTIVKDFLSADISEFFVSRNIYGYNMLDNSYHPIYQEIRIDLNRLKTGINCESEMLNNKYITSYFKEISDKKLLKLINDKHQQYLPEAFSLNLDIKNILQESFFKFSELVTNSSKVNSVIIELHISDIFGEFKNYLVIQKLLNSLDFKLCIKGLSSDSFLQLDKEKIKTDLFKIYCLEEDLQDLNKTNILKKMIEYASSNRIILYKCNDQKILEYGKKLGIKLFQGDYVDMLYSQSLNQDLTNNASSSKWELYKN